MRLTALPAPELRSPHPTGAVSRAVLAKLGVVPQSQVEIRNGAITIGVWVFAREDVSGGTTPSNHDREDVVWLSKRARDLLCWVEGTEVEVFAPAVERLRVVEDRVGRTTDVQVRPVQTVWWLLVPFSGGLILQHLVQRRLNAVWDIAQPPAVARISGS